jgi:hypothetical protein
MPFTLNLLGMLVELEQRLGNGRDLRTMALQPAPEALAVIESDLPGTFELRTSLLPPTLGRLRQLLGLL